MSLKDQIRDKWHGLNKQMRVGLIALVSGAIAVPALLNLGGSTPVDGDALEAPLEQTSVPEAAVPAEAPKQRLHAAPVKKSAPAAKKQQAKKTVKGKKGKKSAAQTAAKKKGSKNKKSAKLKQGKKSKTLAKATPKKKKKLGAKSKQTRAGH